jgi:small subunit ribosomal protein S11
MFISIATFARFRRYNNNKFVFSKKPQPKKPGFVNELDYPRIYIRNNSKTLFFTLTNKSGQVLCSFSSGMAGFKGSKRLGTPAIDSLSRKVAMFAKQLNMKAIIVVLKVTNNLYNITAIKILFDHGLKVLKIVERVPLSHNGRRFKKTRRI